MQQSAAGQSTMFRVPIASLWEDARRLASFARSYYPRLFIAVPKSGVLIGEDFMSMQRLPSDVLGLSKVMPPLSRRGFMSTSAAAAAGYTLAAGPVRADAIHTR